MFIFPTFFLTDLESSCKDFLVVVVASLGMARFGSGNCRRHGSGWEALVSYESNFSFLIHVLGADL